MTRAQFWKIIERSRAEFNPSPSRRDGNMHRQLTILTRILTDMSSVEVLSYAQHVHELFWLAYRWDLWAAAYIIAGGCSDDGFTDFRCWLISIGEDDYSKALKSPENLCEIASRPGVEDIHFEEFGYVEDRIYEDKTGKRLPDLGRKPDEPAGQRFDEDPKALQKQFPRLFDKFWR